MLHGRTEEVGHTVGPPRHRHFVGFSSVPVRVPTRGHPFYGYYEVKSRKYQGVFEEKSRVKTWQVRGIWSQQLEH